MEGIFVYDLEYMLTLVSLDKKQNISTLTHESSNLRAGHLKVIQVNLV